MAMPNRNIVGDYRYNYQGQELDKETGKVAFQLRLYDPRINRWLTTDPKKEFHSPYLSMGNNWMNKIDPDGGSTESTGVRKNEDGTYTVVDVNINDGDNGVYIVDENGNWDINTSQKIGYTSTLYSFYNSDTQSAQKGAIINPTDFSGGDFLAGLMSGPPNLLSYMKNGTRGGKYDFKVTNGTDKVVYSDVTDYYRGMTLSAYSDGLPIFASARDIGNIGAGYIAAHNNIHWGYARLAFDALETAQKEGYIKTHMLYPLNKHTEGIGTQAAQLLGYKYHELFNKK